MYVAIRGTLNNCKNGLLIVVIVLRDKNDYRFLLQEKWIARIVHLVKSDSESATNINWALSLLQPVCH